MQNQGDIYSKTFIVKKPIASSNRRRLRLPKMNRLQAGNEEVSSSTFAKEHRRSLHQQMDSNLAKRIEMIVTLQEFHEKYQDLHRENYPWMEYLKTMFDLLNRIFQDNEHLPFNEKEFYEIFKNTLNKAELMQSQWWDDDDYRTLFWREWLSQMQYIFFFENDIKEPEAIFVKALRFTNKYIEVLAKIEKMLKEKQLATFRSPSGFAGIDHPQAKHPVLVSASAPRN